MNLPESFTSSIEKLLGADEAEQLCGELQKAGAPAKIVGEIIPRAEKEIYVLG